MTAELGLLSLNQLQILAQSQQNQLQKLAQSQQNRTHMQHNPDLWMWNPKSHPHDPDDDSWEVRAFAEDTSNAMGTTWPPRSYTCSFCRREFRSAQALGGHMNVHRRDRARLHQWQPPGGEGGATVPLINQVSSPSSTTQEFVTDSGLSLIYQLPCPNGVLFTSPPMNDACSIDSPSTLLSISPYNPSSNSTAAAGTLSINFPETAPPGLNSCSSLSYSTKAESSGGINLNDGSNCKETSTEDVDLELRLGHRPTT